MRIKVEMDQKGLIQIGSKRMWIKKNMDQNGNGSNWSEPFCPRVSANPSVYDSFRFRFEFEKLHRHFVTYSNSLY